VILGLSFGPIYPTAIAMATERFSQAAGAVTSRIQAIASLGGMALSWMLGVVLTRHGTFAFAFVMTMFTAAMWGVRWNICRRERAHAVATVDSSSPLRSRGAPSSRRT
jgi:fucose permease